MTTLDLETALTGLRTAAPPSVGSRRARARSAWPTSTPRSTRRSARSSSPGTAAASRGSRPATTAPTFERTFRAKVGREIEPRRGPAAEAPRVDPPPARRRSAGPDRPRPPRPQRVRGRGLDEGAGDPAGRGPAVRLDRRRDRASRRRFAPSGRRSGHNPVPLVVPCHRVVRSDGFIGQYSMGGPEAKRRILAAEGLDTRALEADAAAGRRYTGSDTTHIVCHPTCRDARRVTERHKVTFPSLVAAAVTPATGRASTAGPCRGGLAGLGRGELLEDAGSGSAGRRGPCRAIGVRAGGCRVDRLPLLPPDILEQADDDLADVALRPQPHDPAVDPDRRAGVAVACRRAASRGRRGRSRAPPRPSSSCRGRAGARPTAADRRRPLEVVGQREAEPGRATVAGALVLDRDLDRAGVP